ncbi:hypothetical protein F66182_6080 [Fusarium sp. NRRL 66182]|nr:hypothetical protein F66182_6080 [Fusarium sp. NRRL 66182]
MANSTDTPEGYAPFDLYPYSPAQPPAYAFVALFAVAGLVHFVLMFPYRSAFPIPMIIGCGMEAAAYYFRSQSHDDIRRTLPFLLQNLLILVAPPFLAATIYMSLSRITRALKAEELSLIGLGWMTKLFVLVDVICFATQTAGSIMSGSDDMNEASNGRTAIMAGLVLQVLAFALFITCGLTLHQRLDSNPSAYCPSGVLANHGRYFAGLYATCGLFLVRNIIRIVEYSGTGHGDFFSSEIFIYVFEGCFMLGIIVIMSVLHPGHLIRRARKAQMLKEDVPLVSR